MPHTLLGNPCHSAVRANSRMYTLTTPGLLSVSPMLDVNIGGSISGPHATLPMGADRSPEAARVFTPGGGIPDDNTAAAAAVVTDDINETPTETAASTDRTVSSTAGRTNVTFPSGSTGSTTVRRQPLRVGFVSKFFGEQVTYGYL